MHGSFRFIYTVQVYNQNYVYVYVVIHFWSKDVNVIQYKIELELHLCI